MPNEPLQTFRAVEPAHWGFGAISTLASQPFVLNHFTTGNALGTGAAQTNVAVSFDGSALNANRFKPWVSRDFDNSTTTGAYYPVKVPNAYDRIYIFPMYYAVRSANAVSSFGSLAAYTAPFILPMGLTPQTRGFTTVNKLNPKMYRFPDDIPTANGYTRQTNSYTIRDKGLWIPLSSYATNALTSNGAMGAAAATDARSFGRVVVGTGTTYQLPNDVSISTATTTGLSSSAWQYASVAAGAEAEPIVGMGLEFQTHGCEEIVCVLGSLPTGMNLNIAAGDGQAHRVELFLMGMFLG